MTGVLTIVAFYKRESDAVFLAKTFVIFCFASNLFLLLTCDMAELGGSREVARMVVRVVWCAVWFIYLCRSKLVNRLIPKSVRKTKPRDWAIIAVIVLVPLSFAVYVFVSELRALSYAEDEAVALSNLKLSANQYTDGRIILTVPDGVECEEVDFENTKVLYVPDLEGVEVVVASDYDDDATKKNFDEYWEGWKDEDELKDEKYEIVRDERLTRGDMTIFYKTIRYKLDDPIYWEFAMVFDGKTGKICVISNYASMQDGPLVPYIIDNLKFL